MPDTRDHHISSAVVAAMPGRSEELVARIGEIEGAEVYGHENGRIVVVLEGRSTGEVGGRLTEIACLDGVISANMVFEQVEKMEVTES